uniref:Cytokinin riboside 5'-monophosphate phosphoribohydrolase n=1 Tax=Rhodococcus sp. NS1 TaxID=402236 RepID=A0A097SQS4_9NOCA|nr:hypothetical protein LRS1606.452 [Rhodococcus sp. NS1]
MLAATVQELSVPNRSRLSRVTVFAGSTNGNSPEFRSAAIALGNALAQADVGIVCGGGVEGLMGALTETAHTAGGEVIGIVPHVFATNPTVQRTVTAMETVTDVRARKQRMADLGDAFIALPGGLGTLDELFDVWALAQLGVHAKSIALLNTNGYWDSILTALTEMARSGFLSDAHATQLIVEQNPARIIARLRAIQRPPLA